MRDPFRTLDFFTFGGVNSLDYGAILSECRVIKKPGITYTRTAVPGRSGDLYTYEERMENVDIAYDCQITHDLLKNFDTFNALMTRQIGYRRIEDTLYPERFRLGVFRGALDPAYMRVHRSAKFTVTFNCKPQHYLKAGERVQTYTASGTIRNPALFESRPLIRVYGAGVVNVGSYKLTIASHTSAYMDIDCDIEDAFCGTTNLNSYLTIDADDYPRLNEGDTGIVLGTGITKVEITPRWYTV